MVQSCNSPQGMEILESRGELGNLGEGLDHNGGRMNRQNIQLSLDYVRRYLRIAQSRHADRIELVGTEVFRRATNVGEFRALLPKPLSLWILKPEEEAVGSFLAAGWGLAQRPPVDRPARRDRPGRRQPGSRRRPSGESRHSRSRLSRWGQSGPSRSERPGCASRTRRTRNRAFTNTLRPRSAVMPMISPRSEPRRWQSQPVRRGSWWPGWARR